MAAATTEAKELELVGKVELRIALADSEAKLQTLLKTYLAPLLLKLASEHVSVRNKVISVCQHVNTRTKPQSIQLPVAALLKQFKENPATPLIRHFDILYIQQGVPRLPPSERVELLPTLIHGIAKDASSSAAHGGQLFHLLLSLLGQFKLPERGSKEDQQLREKLNIEPEDAKLLSFWFGKLLLLTIRRGPSAAADGSGSHTCPGLSVDEYQFLTLQEKSDAWDPTATNGLNLTEAKINATKFLASGAFQDEERFLPAVFASADPNSRLAEIGEDILKRTVPVTDFENRGLVSRLYEIYFGVRPGLRTKILLYLAKSVTATRFPNEITRLVGDGLTSEHNSGDSAGSVRGREAFRLRSAIFAFVDFLARRGAPEDLRAVAPILIQRLKGFIEDQGWPIPNRDEDIALRGIGYEAIGLLSKASRDPNVGLLRWLFRALSEDSSGREVAVSIEEALSTVLDVFSRTSDPSVKEELQDLLLHNMQMDQSSKSNVRRSTRYVTVRYANRCLPYNSIPARWIDILAVGGASSERQEISEEGRKGLDPYWFQMLNAFTLGRQGYELAFPKFSSSVQYLFFPDDHSVPPRENSNLKVLVDQFKQQHPNELVPVVNFCRQMLFQEALKSKDIDLKLNVNWERNLSVAVSTESSARLAVRDYIRLHMNDGPSSRYKTCLQILIRASFEALMSCGSATRAECGEALLQLCALSLDGLVAVIAQDYQALEPLMFSNDVSIRTVAANVYGILASHETAQGVDESISSLLQKMQTALSSVGAEANKGQGAIVGLGYYFARLNHRKGAGAVFAMRFGEFATSLYKILEQASDKSLQEACCSAIDQLCLFYVSDPSQMPYRKVVDKVLKAAQAGNDRAILALGRLGMIAKDSAEEGSDICYVEDQIHSLHAIRQAEAQFSVGEALSCLACGWDSRALAAKLDVEGSMIPKPKRENALARILERTLNDCKASKPSLRKASVIWLLCLVQFCGHLPQVKEQLRSCQAAFTRCLSDRDDLVQEAASRGLGLVYEQGDRQLKDDLVRDLVGSFSDNKPQLVGNVTEDTQLFEEGALPTGEGSVTTYKDILNLASEVGDSSLVYRFMSLAANNAIWSSRAAFGRFGLSNVFSDSSVDGYLAQNPRLYPKLYRYRFDPNPNVQRSMNDIWNALVKDPSATIEEHFNAIMEDLLQNILAKEWRVRQASCAAIADLVQGRTFDKYEKYLGRIWTLCFKVMDDIKESVRAAAASLARVLTGILIRGLEAGDSSSKSADAMLKHVLPFLLSTSGLESSAVEVQGFALQTLLQIIKKSSGKTLQPFLPELVERLTGLLSSLEPQAVNYLHLNASKYNLTEQKIDGMRLAGIRQSPLMEAIERCLDLLDNKMMAELSPRLEAAMKSAVGLPTKVGCSRILVSLSTRHNLLFRPHADHFLKLLEKHVLDRNDTVSSSYAVAAGYVARLTSDKQILQMTSFAKRLYFTSEDDRHRVASGDIIYAVSKHATDRFAALSAELLPFVFIAKHDSHEHVKELYQNTWNENVGGSRAVLLYIKEITTIALEHIDSPKWVLKHTAARAIADAVTAITSPGDDISLANAEILWPAIDKAMAGKTWEGKEVVLQAFVRFVEKGSKLWTTRADVAGQITKVIVREAKRQNKTYQQFAIRALGQVAAARTDMDMSSTVYEIVSAVVEDALTKDGDAMDVDSGDNSVKSDNLRDRTLAGAIESLADSVNPSNLQGSGLAKRILDILNLIVKVNTIQSTVIRITAFDALKSFFGKVGQDDVDWLQGREAEYSSRLKELLFGHSDDALSEAQRLKKAQAIAVLARFPSKATTETLLADLVQRIATERSPVVRQELEKARQSL